MEFKHLILGALILIAGCTAVPPVKPDENRFTPVVLTKPGDLDEPNTFEVLKDGRVLISERKGAVKVFDPRSGAIRLAGMIPVNTKYTSKKGVVTEAEEGLLGLTIDPGFEKNHWVYTFYSHATESRFQLTRWELRGNQLVKGSEKVMLHFTTQRETCCHTGGGMTWDKDGNLYLTVGNNTGTSLSSSTDERPDRVNWDDQRGTANSNSLIGKILRIHPEPDGSYVIPKGNLFPPGLKGTKGEIYTMGHRNPWRPSIDSKTGYLYWGDIGPDANEDSDIGPMGYDEFNQARKPGFFGWPYFVGPNAAFPIFDYVGGELLGAKDPKMPTNTSVNNTGLKELPPVSRPFIYYPYGTSAEFPLAGSGSRSATGGPVYRRDDFPAAERPWPEYYEGKWLITDLARGWILSVTMTPDGDYQSMERFLPSYQPVEPIDMKFGPAGDLYVLEYGNQWFSKSASAKLVRIGYNNGNRVPVVNAAADKTGGSVPLKIKLSSAGTRDADGDKLTYKWKISAPGQQDQLFETANPDLELKVPGEYTAKLTVTDNNGGTNIRSFSIVAGNSPPRVKINIAGNSSFFFDEQPLGYTVSVEDEEDGSLAAGTIPKDQVAVSIDYAPAGFDHTEILQGHRSVDASAGSALANAIIKKTDCMNCHAVNSKNIGPSFTQVARKYKGDPNSGPHLADRIRRGGGGVWGKQIAMPAHPSLTENDAKTLVSYILNIADKKIGTLPVKGQYVTAIPAGDAGNGHYLVRAAYTDKGSGALPKQTAETVLVLRSATIGAPAADLIRNAVVKVNGVNGSVNVIPNKNGFIAFRNIDLSGIKQVEFKVSTSMRDVNPGGRIEIREGSAAGALLGEASVLSSDAGAAAKEQHLTGNLKSVSGKRNLYFVFRNELAAKSDPLFSLQTIQFKAK